MLFSFRNNLSGRRLLNADLGFHIKHVLLSDDGRDRIFSLGGWKEFYRRYPDCRGTVDLSRVGFNKKERRRFCTLEINGIIWRGGMPRLYREEWRRMEGN